MTRFAIAIAAALGVVHHGDVCGPPARCYIQVGDTTEVVTRDRLVFCCWVPGYGEPRQCVDRPGRPECEVTCQVGGCPVVQYTFPALAVDHNGDGAVDLKDFAEVQNGARR